MRTNAVWIALALIGSVQRASADDTIERADRLFAEGKALFDKDLPRACGKFEASLQLNPQAIGTLLNVALCDEKLGRYASAVARFGEALERAKEGHMVEHRQVAEQHLADLTPKVSHLTIRLAEQRAATKIVIDDKLVDPAQLAELAIDQGEHAIVVSAPGRLPYQTKFRIAVAEHLDVAIPTLASSVTVKSSRRTIGKVTTISGGVLVGTGIVLGYLANRSYQQQLEGAMPHCTRPMGVVTCDDVGYSNANSALTMSDVGTVVFFVGVAAVGAGTYLWLRAPKDTSERRVTVVPQVGPSGGGIAAVGTF